MYAPDNDIISKNIIELWYDSDNDGKYDKLLETYDGRMVFLNSSL